MRAKSVSFAPANAVPAFFRSAIDNSPYLSAEEERSLALRYRDLQDKRAADRIIRAHLRLAIRMASRFFGYGLPIEDLVSEANVGLVRALETFDPDKGFRFSTYSMWWIRAALLEYVTYNTSMVKIGTTASQRNLFYRLRAMKSKLGAYANGNLSSEVIQLIASNLKVEPQAVVEMNGRLGGDSSLNDRNLDGSELIDMLEDYAPTPEALEERKRVAAQHQRIIEEGMVDMTDRERDIIVRRKLVDAPLTLGQLGKLYGVSQERIRQIEALAIRKFKLRTKEITPQFAD